MQKSEYFVRKALDKLKFYFSWAKRNWWTIPVHFSTLYYTLKVALTVEQTFSDGKSGKCHKFRINSMKSDELTEIRVAKKLNHVLLSTLPNDSINFQCTINKNAILRFERNLRADPAKCALCRFFQLICTHLTYVNMLKILFYAASAKNRILSFYTAINYF